jgi:hypothetical protein
MPVEGIDPYSTVVPPEAVPPEPVEQPPPEAPRETVEEEYRGNNINTTA